MADAEGNNTFAAIPLRAMADEALTAEHFRVLMAIAAHDRFGRNGRGCYAPHPRLAQLAGCHLKSLSRSMRVLAERGYIEAAPHPYDRRQRAYRVIYNDADFLAFMAKIGNEPATNGVAIGNEPAADHAPIGNRDFQETQQPQWDADDNISCKTLNRCCETEKYTVNGITPDGVDDFSLRKAGKRNLPDQPGRTLGEIESFLKTLNGRQLNRDEIERLRRAENVCSEIESEHNREKIGYWAERVGYEIGDRLAGDE